MEGIIFLILAVSFVLSSSGKGLRFIQYDHLSSQGKASSQFSVIWNIPDQNCSRDFNITINVTQFGIQENSLDGWIGEDITIFYGDEMGLYPYVSEDGHVINGGIPQAVDLEAHREKCETDIRTFIPDSGFSGLGVIDYENWRPLWDRNYDTKVIYRNLSESLVREQHPTWPQENITNEAKRQFEQAAQNFMEATLEVAKQLRPAGQWGYYLFPDCYNYDGQRKCSHDTKDLNDKLLWLFEDSSALYPSSYLPDSSSPVVNQNYVYGTLNEANRMRQQLSDKFKPIYLYTRIRYRNNVDWYTSKDLENSVKQAHDLGLDGVVIWDDHYMEANSTMCEKTKLYVDLVLGPFVQDILSQGKLRKEMVLWQNRHHRGKPFNRKWKNKNCGTSVCMRRSKKRLNRREDTILSHLLLG